MRKRLQQFRARHTQAPPLEQHSTLEQLLHNDAASAIILLFAAGVAFFCANSAMPFYGNMTLGEFYHNLWHMEIGFAIHTTDVTQPLHLWINDGLMAIFFFVVGLEIKRELLVGELASFRKAILPVGAALGGMVVPAGIYALFNIGGDGLAGWGIPMATDIAFAVGVLGLLAGRVPVSLVVFLTALAIVDDLGAVLVIAIFYTDSIAATQLFAGLSVAAVSFLFSFFGVRNAYIYVLLFILIWFTFLQSGVHATIAGVLFAFTIPADARYESPVFVKRIQHLLGRFEEVQGHSSALQVSAAQQGILGEIEKEVKYVEAPLQRIERTLHPATAFLIMPIFAFANAGVALDLAHLGEMLLSPVTLGVAFGLFAGKQIGITGSCWAMVKFGLAELPRGVNWRQVYAISMLGSIGFTMSLFVTELAFAPGGHAANVVHAEALAPEPATPRRHILAAPAHSGADAHLIDEETARARQHNAEAKLGVFVASILAGITGTIALYSVTKPGGGELHPAPKVLREPESAG